MSWLNIVLSLQCLGDKIKIKLHGVEDPIVVSCTFSDLHIDDSITSSSLSARTNEE